MHTLGNVTLENLVREPKCPRTGLPTFACECYEYDGALPGGLAAFKRGLARRYGLVKRGGTWFRRPEFLRNGW